MDGPRDLAAYIRELEPRRRAPAAQRDVRRERRVVAEYLETLAPADRRRLEDWATSHPPMAPETRLAVLLPARFEERRIGRFLAALESETARFASCGSTSVVELIVLENRKAGEVADGTAAILRRAASRRTGFRLVHLEREWDAEEARFPLRQARQLLADYALFRAARRPSQAPLYLMSEDADVEAIEADRSYRVIRHLDRHPQLDAVRGVQERTPAALAANHLLLFERRSWFFTERLLSARRLRPDVWAGANFYWNRVVTSGWNTAFTAEAYALIGGYSQEVRIFEDLDIGQRISVLRGGWRGQRFVPEVGTVARVPFRAVSSAARAARALAQRRHIYDEAGDFSAFFSRQEEQAVRCLSLDELLAALAPWAEMGPDNLDRFEEVAGELYREIRRILGDPGRAQRLFQRAMFFTGFGKRELALDGGGVRLLDTSRFRRGAGHFVARTGPPPCAANALDSSSPRDQTL